MTNMNISLTQEAYNYLKALKGKDKSFSEVVIEFKEERGNGNNTKSLLRFAGALKDANIDWDEKEKRMKEVRASFNKRLGARKDD